jgi:hypothetical protein
MKGVYNTSAGLNIRKNLLFRYIKSLMNLVHNLDLAELDFDKSKHNLDLIFKV